MKKSLRRNLFIATIAIVLGCIGPMVTYILESSFIREKKDVEKTVIAISREAANKIKAKVDEETALIHAFAKLPNITRTDYTGEELEAHKDVIEKCAFFIPYYSKQPEKYENVAFYNKEGFLALPNGALIQLKNKPYIIGPCSGKGDYIDDPRPSTAPGTEGQIFMFISTVVTDANDAPIGCMVSVLKGNVLDMVCDTIEVAPGYHPIIVNTKSKEVVTTLNNVSEKDVDAYNKFIMDLTSKKVCIHSSRQELMKRWFRYQSL